MHLGHIYNGKVKFLTFGPYHLFDVHQYTVLLPVIVPRAYVSADKQNIKQTVWTQIRSNTLLGLIWIQTVIVKRMHLLFDCTCHNQPTYYPLRKYFKGIKFQCGLSISSDYLSVLSRQPIQLGKFYECKIVTIFIPINLNICFGCSKEPSH